MESVKQSDKDIKRLTLKRRYGQRLQIGEASVYVEYLTDTTVSFHVDAPPNVKVLREELLDRKEGA